MSEGSYVKWQNLEPEQVRYDTVVQLPCVTQISSKLDDQGFMATSHEAG